MNGAESMQKSRDYDMIESVRVGAIFILVRGSGNPTLTPLNSQVMPLKLLVHRQLQIYTW